MPRVRYCSMVPCDNNKGMEDATEPLFAAPSQPELRQKWLDAITAYEPAFKSTTKALRLCRLHFDSGQCKYLARGWVLVPGSVPKHFQSKPDPLQVLEKVTETAQSIAPKIEVKTEPIEKPNFGNGERIIKIVNPEKIAQNRSRNALQTAYCVRCIQTEVKVQNLQMKLSQLEARYKDKLTVISRLQNKIKLMNSMLPENVPKTETCPICSIKLSKIEFQTSHLCIDGKDLVHCQYCSQSFTSTRSMVLHLDVFHDDKTFYECDRCDKTVGMEELLQFHLSTHSDEEPQFPCNKCEWKFYKQKRLDQHIENEHPDPDHLLSPVLKPYKCGSCGECFDVAAKLRDHINVEHLSKMPKMPKMSIENNSNNGYKFECYVCKRKLSSLAQVRDHLTKHDPIVYKRCLVCNEAMLRNNFKNHLCSSDRSVVPCEYCSDKFQSTSKILNHLDKFHGDDKKMYRCTVCPKYFPMKLLRDIHSRKHSIKTRTHFCDTCEKSFFSRAGLYHHLKTHNENQRKHLCDECGKSYRSPRDLEIHKYRHTEPKIQCTDCPKRFHFEYVYKMHRNVTHSNIKYVCEICDAELSSHAGLNDHIKSQHKRTDADRHFECTICSKRFFENNILKKHVDTVHSTIKQFPCSYCEAAYKHKGDLNKHLRTHLGDDMYHCPKCPERFRKPDDLRKHSYVHYKEEREKQEASTSTNMDQS